MSELFKKIIEAIVLILVNCGVVLIYTVFITPVNVLQTIDKIAIIALFLIAIYLVRFISNSND